MKFYSEELNKFFDSAAECEEAEETKRKEVEAKAKAEAEKSAARKARAKEVEDAMKRVVDARKEYDELMSAFCRDYGAFHYTVDLDNSNVKDVFKMLNWF